MGTETASGSESRDVREKILRYQHYFRSNAYKFYESIWSTKLTGFRVLFLANSKQRMGALSVVVRAIRPSDFAWVSCEEQMFADGISGNIWARGGIETLDSQSILGSLAHPAPLQDGDSE